MTVTYCKSDMIHLSSLAVCGSLDFFPGSVLENLRITLKLFFAWVIMFLVSVFNFSASFPSFSVTLLIIRDAEALSDVLDFGSSLWSVLEGSEKALLH